MVSRLLLRAGLRYHVQHPLQLGLTVLGVALGVAVVVAVDIATDSARRAFTLSTEAVSGRATHEITGGPAGLPDSIYTRLRVGTDIPGAVPGATVGMRIEGIAPVVDRQVRIRALTPTVDTRDTGVESIAPVTDRDTVSSRERGEVMRLLGIDPFAEAPFRTFVAPASGDIDVGAVITARTLLLGSAAAARLGVAAGDSVTIRSGTQQHRAVIAALLAPADDLAAHGLDDVVIADIATAQELTASIGVLDRIELRVAADDSAAMLAYVRTQLPAGARVSAIDARTRATLRLTRAFDTNLTALALVALVFGMFLIYNSVTFSLVQRRPLLGLLRAQGVTARELLNLITAEAIIIGAAASALGLAAGYVLATQLLQLVARTINDLYFAVSVTAVHLDVVVLLRTGLLGIAATVAAALPPALEAVRTRPRVSLAASTLERRSRRNASRLAGAGIVTAIIAAALLAVPSLSVVIGFAALFVLILAAALLTPAATIALMSALSPVLTRAGPVARMAARGVSATLSRTAPAIAALSVAIAVGIAVTIMIGSFRAGVVRWLDHTLEADLYLSAPGFGPDRFHNTLDPQLVAEIATTVGVAGVSRYRHVSVLVAERAVGERSDFVTLIAVDLFARHRDAFELLDGEADTWSAFERGAVLVSEPIAFRRGIAAGDSIALPTDRGLQRFPIAAIFRDYSSEHGLIFMDRAVYDRHWDDEATTTLAVFVADGADVAEVLARVRALPEAAGVNVRSNAGLRDATLQVFDRTFVITGVLRLLALIVAFVGVTGALMALQLERRREIGMLRAVGLTPGQVWTLVTTQTALMGLTAAAIAVPLGLAMSWAMVNVINRRSFGWSFDMLIGAEPFIQGLAIGIGAAVLAGVYPAWRMSRLVLVLALACAPAADPPASQTLQLSQLLGGADTLHARAVEPRAFEFPADHGQHPDFRTEWWYFTGNLTTEDGRAFGYQLTFFRSALVDSASFAGARPTATGNSEATGTSAWRTRHAWMAHFAVSDDDARRFRAAERFARGAIGLAGAESTPFRVWLGDWAATNAPNDRDATIFPLTLRAAHGDVAIDLLLEDAKALVLHGERGLSRKGAQPGNASYYYSFTRIATRGTITIDGTRHRVSGASWLDREWSTSVLADSVVGWDWLALQLADSTELMLYRLRRDDGTADPFSAGTFVAADGSTTHLSSDAFTMMPARTWSRASYPTSWRIAVPALDVDFEVEAAFEAQELVLAVRYWEGMVRATGTRRGVPVTARGYLEMTGYADTATTNGRARRGLAAPQTVR